MRKIEPEEYKRIVLSILIRIDKICRENNLVYQLAFGTLLGCVRHKGFIPWDDDADIIMPRDDYEKLEKIINSGEYGLTFIDPNNSKDTIYAFGKVCDINTTLYENNYKKVEKLGAFVDVFPLDYMPDNEKACLAYCKRFRKIMLLITHSGSTGYHRADSIKTNILRFFAFYLTRPINTRKLILKMNSQLKSFNNSPTNHLGIPWDESRASLPVDVIYDTIDGEFEGHDFLIPNDYDYVLTLLYGEYMKLPPINDRINKHNLECYIQDNN